EQDTADGPHRRRDRGARGHPRGLLARRRQATSLDLFDAGRGRMGSPRRRASVAGGPLQRRADQRSVGRRRRRPAGRHRQGRRPQPRSARL
ncbi:MAG: hypothetical protein AVDCRST_MAG53-3570, partial [uncultured Solirubrobacteraceae bacterium]